MPKVFLIDGHSLLFRAHFAFIRRPLINSKGMDTSALFGFFNMLMPLFEREKPDLAAVAFDVSRVTFRTQIFPDYKGHRDECPAEIKVQTPLAQDILRAMGRGVITLPDFEADDVLGTLATRHAADGDDVTIVTGDRDALQLVGDRISVLLTKKGISETVLYTPELVVRDYGVEPVRLIDVKALQGDASDNIPGVRGVGEKGALKLIQEYGTLDNLYEHVAEVKGKLQEKLTEGRDSAFMSRQLATIIRDAPLPDDVAAPPPGDIDELARLLGELELHKLAALVGLPPSATPSLTADGPAEEATAPVPVLPPAAFHAVVGPEALAALVDRLASAPRIALDTETTGVDAHSARLVGMSFAVDEDEAFYLPLAHEDPAADQTPLTITDVLETLRPVLTRPDVELTGHNLKYDYQVLRRHGLHLPTLGFDTLIAAYLLEPSAEGFGLDVLARKLLGHVMLQFKDVVGEREHFGLVPLADALPYAADDASTAFRLAARFEPELRQAGLLDLFRTLEMPLVRVLADMELAGIRIDAPYLEKLGLELATEIDATQTAVWSLTGEEFNLNSPKQLGEILFGADKMGLPVVRYTGKTKAPSTDSETLETLERNGVEVARLINRHRHLVKLKGTYVDPLPDQADEHGRIHSSFHQFVAATGRLSSSNPNLQNIPVRTEDGRRIRRAFLAGEGFTFVSADYSQIELRILAHMSDSPILREAFAAGRDIHRETAARVFAVAPEDVDGPMRDRAKAINFGIIYGQSDFGLSQQLGIDRRSAREFIERYFSAMPEVLTFKERLLEKAHRDAGVTTLLGRRRSLPRINGKGQDRQMSERMAVNTVIQGTAADLIKLAMVELDRRLHAEGLRSRLLLQIHDELVLECPHDETPLIRDLLRGVMEGAMQLSIPLTVGISEGATWADLK